LMFTTGFLLIPSFTRIIANTEFRIIPIGKKIISYLPLFAGFAILFYVSLGFLGIYDYRTIQLGGLVSEGRMHWYDAPWASFWPGGIAFLIVISLFVLHEGLAKSSR
jgi:ABC-type dipeptide/oligopeptide/nickel transport system permease subunit